MGTDMALSYPKSATRKAETPTSLCDAGARLENELRASC
jgi:hypothetical protein